MSEKVEFDPNKKEAAADLVSLSIDWAELDGKERPPRRWAWEPWIPAGTVTLLHGFGGVGKTLLAQQICTAFALGQPLFGSSMAGGGALLLAGEDDREEIWRRQLAICRREEVSLSDCAERLDVVLAPHVDITIARTVPGKGVCPLPMYQSLRQHIERLEPGLVALDNAAKLFDIDHSSNTEVNRAVAMLRALCEGFDTSVLLLAHNSKSNEYFGSVQWENAARSRLSMTRDENDKDLVLLQRPKANYADREDGGLGMRWDHGSFKAEDSKLQSMVDRIAAETRGKEVEAALLAFIDQRNSENRPVSHSKQAGNFLDKEFLDTPEGQQFKKIEIRYARETLFRRKVIKGNMPICRGPDRHKQNGIARVDTSSASEAAE